MKVAENRPWTHDYSAPATNRRLDLYYGETIEDFMPRYVKSLSTTATKMKQFTDSVNELQSIESKLATDSAAEVEATTERFVPKENRF